jgi:hypothetical protein
VQGSLNIDGQQQPQIAKAKLFTVMLLRSHNAT